MTLILRHLRSYVCRSRMTPAQKNALASAWSQYGLELQAEKMDFESIFGKKAPCFLEIGFGSGQSLLALAKANPDQHFIGIEIYPAGVGNVLAGIKTDGVHNLRLFKADATQVLTQVIPDESLAGIHLFFPDPWPKRRHHPRRLIQPPFVKQMVTKLIPGGTLHLATDWEDYAKHMLKVLTNELSLKNLVNVNQFAARSPYRPVVTKFEARALRENRAIWELQFAKQ